MNNPLISIVIPVYISKPEAIEMTRKCLRLAKYHAEYDNIEWIIVETGSKHFIDEADIYVYEEVKTTPNRSINRGLNIARGEYVVFLSNDIFVDRDWVKCLLDCFRVKEDCGLATLGTSQFRQTIENRIIETIYFPIAMMKKEDAWLDDRFTNCFDDTDLIMRVYLRGQRMYQNLGCIVEHLNRQSQEPITITDKDYIDNKNKLIDKYKEFSNTDIYKKLVEGIVVLGE